MQAVLGEQHLRQQRRSGASARDRMRGRRRLGDRLAGPAGELLAHVLDHLPLARHHLQRLGHVLAQLAQRAAAARAGRRRRIDDALARQMLGQRPARRLASARSRAPGQRRRSLPSSRSRPTPRLRPRSLPGRPAAARAGRAARRAPTIGRTARAAAWRSRTSASRSRSARACAFASAPRTFASASIRAARSASNIAFSVATSSGRESAALITLR